MLLIFILPASAFSQVTCPVNVDILQGVTAWFCPGDTFVLSATPGLLNYQWSNGLTSDSILITQPGTYWVNTTGPMAACTDWDTISVFMYQPAPEIQLNITGTQVNLCEGEELKVTVTNPVYFFYRWNYNGLNSPQTTIDSTGFYWVVAWDNNGCRDSSETFTVNMIPNPIPVLGPDTIICSADSLQLNPGAFNSYAWSTGSGLPAVWVSNAVTYSVTVTDGNGCQGSDTIQVAEKPTSYVNLGPDSTICFGDMLLLLPGGGGGNYLWQDASTGNQYAVTDPGLYWVRLTAPNGCISPVDSVIIAVDTPPVPVITSALSLLSIPQQTTHQWYFNGSPIPGETGYEMRPTSTGEYYVTTTDPYGCAATSEILLWETRINLIRAFTPNGDGFGDFFVLENIDLFPGAIFKVFNRWGTVVYEKEGYDNSWNGTSNEGIELPVGTYFFSLDLKDGSKPVNDYLILNR